MHSEARKTETLESGAGKSLFAAPSKENRWLVLKIPEVPDGLGGRSFYRQNLDWELQGMWLSSDWLMVDG